MKPELRPYQNKAIDETERKFEEGFKRPLIVAPTGAGKTTIGGEIVRRAVERGERVLWIAHRKELIDQAVERLRLFGLNPGVIMAGRKPAPQLQVQVASIQTISRRENAAHRISLIFVDEAHHIHSTSYKSELALFPDAHVIGLTATPWRLDGKGLSDLFDSHVIAATPHELMTLGYLSPLRAYKVKQVADKGVHVRGGEFVAHEFQEAAIQINADVVRIWREKADGKRTIVFATSVEHSKRLVELFRESGVIAEHVDGKTPKNERDAIVARFRSGETTLLSNVAIATEGFDCPEIECVSIIRPTLSRAMHLQMIGRGLRPMDGKVAIVLDHSGNLERHGHPYSLTREEMSPEFTVEQSRGMKAVKGEWTCKVCGLLCTVDSRCECPVSETTIEMTNEELTAIEVSQDLKPISKAEKKRRLTVLKQAEEANPELFMKSKEHRRACFELRDEDSHFGSLKKFYEQKGSITEAVRKFKWYSGGLDVSDAVLNRLETELSA